MKLIIILELKSFCPNIDLGAQRCNNFIAADHTLPSNEYWGQW